MKNSRVIIFIGVFFLLNSFCLNQTSGGFALILEQAGIKFTLPMHSKDVVPIRNDELNYQYALLDTVNHLEIRYLVYPLQQLINQYNGPHADTGISKIDPNFIHTNLLMSYAYRIQGKEMSLDGSIPEINELSHATVDLEFNADWGATVDVQPCDEFAQKYKYCTLFAIHKENMADAFILYLYDDKDAFYRQNPFAEGSSKEFHSLVFNKN